MSRAYRITVKESESRDLKGSDEICTQLELIEILPPEAMAGLLADELKNRGFKEQPDGKLVRQDGDTTITVDPCNGEVSVKAEVQEIVDIEVKREATGWDDVGPDQKTLRERVKEDLKKDIDKKAEREVEKLQGKATEKLEKKLDDLQPELGQVINKVTREALKQKAKSLGSIKEVSEDEQSGNLTIKIEV